jgi:hypothetical protein
MLMTFKVLSLYVYINRNKLDMFKWWNVYPFRNNFLKFQLGLDFKTRSWIQWYMLDKTSDLIKTRKI